MATLPDTTLAGVLADGPSWGDRHSLVYRAAGQRNQQRRQRRRARAKAPSAATVAARAAKHAAAQASIEAQYAAAKLDPACSATFWQFVEFRVRAGDPDARLLQRADAEPIFAERRRARRAKRQAEVRLRLSLGYRWLGGPVGGNPAYVRPPFVYPGLVSDEHPMLQLFVASTPRAAQLQTGDTKARIDRVGQKLLALDSAYVAANRAMRRVLRVELDRDFPGGFAALAAAIAARGVPPPNLVVGHVDAAGRLLRPHLLWLLEAAVAFTGKGRPAPQKLWQAVLDGLTAALLPLGADPGGRANALHMKNPLCPAWHRQVMEDAPYTLAPDTRDEAPGLAALAPSLDLGGARALLRQAADASEVKRPAADHPDPDIASQSNGLFRSLSTLARARIGWHRDQGNGCQDAFQRELLAAALELVPPSDAAARRAVATVTRVADWTWNKYRVALARLPCATPEERHDRQSAGQARGAATRRAVTLANLVRAAQDLVARGQRLTQDAVATIDPGRRRYDSRP